MQTRRQWLLQLGGGAVLAGWSGIDLSAAELPPGVYEASRDHLGHALAGHPVAPGGDTELVQIRTGTFQPAFFEPDQYRQLLQLTSIVLGETPDAAIVHEIAEWIDLTVSDAAAVRAAARALSPPHRALAIHFYGAESVRKLEEFDAQKVVRDGFAWINANPLSQVELNEIIAGSKSSHPAAPFLLYLKERVIDGFYTSRAGLDELGYRGNAFYASPPGCEHLYG
jgi:hypothetical protein